MVFSCSVIGFFYWVLSQRQVYLIYTRLLFLLTAVYLEWPKAFSCSSLLTLRGDIEIVMPSNGFGAMDTTSSHYVKNTLFLFITPSSASLLSFLLKYCITKALAQLLFGWGTNGGKLWEPCVSKEHRFGITNLPFQSKLSGITNLNGTVTIHHFASAVVTEQTSTAVEDIGFLPIKLDIGETILAVVQIDVGVIVLVLVLVKFD